MYLYFWIIFAIYIYTWKGIKAVTCPESCECSWIDVDLKVVCSGQNLQDLPDFLNLPIAILDLSNNNFQKFPSELTTIKTLEFLDFSKNALKYLEDDTFIGLSKLRHLMLDRNNFSNLLDIEPNYILKPLENLITFSLAGNFFNSFTSNSEKTSLISDSLKVFDISDCNISKIGGQYLLQGLPKLEKLILNGNPIHSVLSMESNSLEALELRNCNLLHMSAKSLHGLKNLVYLDLSKNHRFSLINRAGDYLSSETLRNIDISYCNMDSINLKGFPNIMLVNLRGNMIRKIFENTFQNNVYIEALDISLNSIDQIESKSFLELQNLKRLDLSFNVIPKIPFDLFDHNSMLVDLNLSRNYIGHLGKITAKSLLNLNVSWCEILTLEENLLGNLPNLRILDLSNNLISTLPKNFSSKTLQVLDLSRCRLDSLRNNSFQHFPKLSSIKLSGNRLTNPVQLLSINKNQFLLDIWIADNPWRCDCNDENFQQIYIHLTKPPAKLNDRNQIHCASPDDVVGKTWDRSCLKKWLENDKKKTLIGKIWTTVLSIILILLACTFILIAVKKYFQKRKTRQNQRELRENIEAQRSILRLNQRILEEEGQPNAPNTRESNPPCYEDAILMPRLQRNFMSLDALNFRRGKSQQNPKQKFEDDTSNEIMISQYHFRSEEVLSVRDKERTAYIVPRRSRQRLCQNSNSRGHSSEKIINFSSFENSPYSKRKPKKDINLVKASISKPPKLETQSSISSLEYDMNIVDNYFQNYNSKSESSSSEFELMNPKDTAKSLSSSFTNGNN